MSFLVNPYIYATGGPAFPNVYSMRFPTYSITPASVEMVRIPNQSNAIDTAIRDTTPNFSASGWYKCNADSDGQIRNLFSKFDNYAGRDRCIVFRLLTDNRIQWNGQYDASSTCINLVTTQTFTTTDGWFHWCIVYDSSQTTAATIAKLYINGVEITAWDVQVVNTTQKYFFNQTTESFRAYVGTAEYAGGSALLPSRGIGGFLDETTFWDKSLSAAEVTEMYNSGAAYDISLMTAYSANCLAWWRMGDDAGDNWNASKWNIINVKGTASTNLVSVNLSAADRVTDAPA